jgi:ABC-type antimicrobial peptide transport system permease subunit
MALGAARGNVLWVVLREAFVLAVIGVTIGLALALASGRLIGSLLFGVEAADPVVLGFAVLGMIAVALLAGYLPARRATRIDPSIALRYE